MQSLEDLEDGLPGCAIEIAGWFVGHQNRRPANERARDGRSLLLSAREFVRTMVYAVFQPDQREAFDRTRAPLTCGHALIQQRNLDILRDVEF